MNKFISWLTYFINTPRSIEHIEYFTSFLPWYPSIVHLSSIYQSSADRQPRNIMIFLIKRHPNALIEYWEKLEEFLIFCCRCWNVKTFLAAQDTYGNETAATADDLAELPSRTITRYVDSVSGGNREVNSIKWRSLRLLCSVVAHHKKPWTAP